jgi:hypothetical protein
MSSSKATFTRKQFSCKRFETLKLDAFTVRRDSRSDLWVPSLLSRLTLKRKLLYHISVKKEEIVREMNKEYRKFVGLAMMFIKSKDEKCAGRMRKSLRAIYIKIGEAGDVQQSDICYAKRLIDQTSDLACFTKSLNSIQLIPSTMQIRRYLYFPRSYFYIW